VSAGLQVAAHRRGEDGQRTPSLRANGGLHRPHGIMRRDGRRGIPARFDGWRIVGWRRSRRASR
jgi:hypothetical protein